MKKITRRDFLKGSAAGVIGTAAMGTMGCMIHQKSSADAPTPADFDKEYDVVVIGLGGAGSASAIEAHDAGARVLILEKQPEDDHYPNTRLSGGYFHFPDPKGDHEELVKYVTAMISGENCPWKLEGEQPHVSKELARMYADGVLHVPEFLMAQSPDLDPAFMQPGGDSSFPMFEGFEKAKYGSAKVVRYVNYTKADTKLRPQERPRLTKSAGEAYHWALVEDGIKTQRPGIDIMYETPVKDLIMAGDKAVGVLATTKDGQDLRVCANRAVIITCGGYEYNLPMRRAFLEGPGVKGWCFYGSPKNTGDGIAMAMKVGAGMAKVGKAASRIEVAVPYGEHYEKEGLKMGIASAITSAKNSMIVDNYGKRYADEFIITDSSRPFRYQFYKEALQYELETMSYPRVPSWLIFDETRRAESCAVAMGYSVAAFGLVPWSKDNLDAVERGWILKADTLEELAEKIKADPENRDMITPEILKENVERFNAYCQKGEDPDFKRSPNTMAPVGKAPFYALKLYPGGPNTKGGIDANAKRQVLDWQGEPIPHLYTAGEISSIFKFTYQGGGNLTECIVCGREAGRNAAAETSWTGHDAPKSGKPDVKLQPTSVAEEEIAEVDLVDCKDGEYSTSVQGMNGKIPVKVTIGGGKIETVVVGENSETAGIGSKAVDMLPNLFVKAQSTQVDVISGATVTSNALIKAVKQCLVQAAH